MKKRYILLFAIFLVMVSGCSIKKANYDSIDDIINNVLLEKPTSSNTSFNGYSYYIPNTLKIENKEEYNTILSDEYNNKYYIYVDSVGYYNKVVNTYKEDSHSYYSKKITSKGSKKEGYLEINEVKGKYFVEAVYNYGKIEVYTSKSHLNNTLINLSQVLSSLKYNDKVLATIIGDNVLNYKEETFNIFTTKKSTTNYLDYIEQYDKSNDKNNNLEDNDQIDINNDDE